MAFVQVLEGEDALQPELAVPPGNSVLRLFTHPDDDAEAEQRIAALLADHELLESTRKRFEEAIMDERIPTELDEKRSIIDQIEEHLTQQVTQQVTREATLAMVRRVLGDDVACELDEIEDPQTLQDRAVELLAAASRRR